jgi:hypothetical protein
LLVWRRQFRWQWPHSADIWLIRVAQAVEEAEVIFKQVVHDDVDQDAVTVIEQGLVPSQRVVIAVGIESKAIPLVTDGPVLRECIVVAVL